MAFFERASRIVWEVQDAVAEVSERRGTLSGPMRLSAPVTFGRMHLGPALYPFLSKHPGISLTLELDDRRVDAAADGYDAVIRHGTVEDSRLVALPLAPSRRLLVASPEYLKRYGKPTTLDALGGHKAIYYTNRNVADWRFLDLRPDAFVRPPASLRVNNGDMMRDAALAGLGLALLPSFIVGEDVKKGALVRVDVGNEAAEEMIYVAHPEGRRASKKIQELVTALRGAFGAPPYWDVV
ncbi:DNA-binding transcriptional regulator, LysR family [Collimonas sp. OK607]|nr:DNA-binding transcriptional regulator, LysR family [Collimonas sp. OK607]